MAGGGYKKGMAAGSARETGKATSSRSTSLRTVRKGMKSETRVNKGAAKMAGKMLPTAARPIRPRGAAASLRPRVAREATAGKPVPKVRALVKRRGRSPK
jgi:hypothetical protein